MIRLNEGPHLDTTASGRTTWQPIAETAETEHGRDLARQSAAVNLEVANRHVMLHGHIVDRQRCQTLFDFL
jgi:hypothetical protein